MSTMTRPRTSLAQEFLAHIRKCRGAGTDPQFCNITSAQLEDILEDYIQVKSVEGLYCAPKDIPAPDAVTLVNRIMPPLRGMTGSQVFNEDVSSYEKAYVEVQAHVDAQTEHLREALVFYANAWDTHPGDSGLGGNDPQDPVCDPSSELCEDGGRIARAALATTKDNHGG